MKFVLVEVFILFKFIFDVDVLFFEIKFVFFIFLKYIKENNIFKYNFLIKYKYFDVINV